jgi:intracellular septation protein A
MNLKKGIVLQLNKWAKPTLGYALFFILMSCLCLILAGIIILNAFLSGKTYPVDAFGFVMLALGLTLFKLAKDECRLLEA